MRNTKKTSNLKFHYLLVIKLEHDPQWKNNSKRIEHIRSTSHSDVKELKWWKGIEDTWGLDNEETNLM